MVQTPGEPFFFGIPLIGRAAARCWRDIDRLLARTLSSIMAQDDPDFVLILAGHDQPPSWLLRAADERLVFLRADWRPEPPSRANDDGGSKKWMIRESVRRAGGGLLMFVDADDLVDRSTVSTARRLIDPGAIGGLVSRGYMIDDVTRLSLPFPAPGVFGGCFSELCGSSTIGRIAPTATHPVYRDPFVGLGSHDQWKRAARSAGVRLRELPLVGGYVVNTRDSHSEHHGPFAAWRRELARSVVMQGAPLPKSAEIKLGLREAAPRPGARVLRFAQTHCHSS